MVAYSVNMGTRKGGGALCMQLYYIKKIRWLKIHRLGGAKGGAVLG